MVLVKSNKPGVFDRTWRSWIWQITRRGGVRGTTLKGTVMKTCTVPCSSVLWLVWRWTENTSKTTSCSCTTFHFNYSIAKSCFNGKECSKRSVWCWYTSLCLSVMWRLHFKRANHWWVLLKDIWCSGNVLKKTLQNYWCLNDMLHLKQN